MGGPGEQVERWPAVVKPVIDGPQTESLGTDSRPRFDTFDHPRSLSSDTYCFQKSVQSPQLSSADLL